MRALACLCLALLLSACSSPAIVRDFDPQRDFAAYHSWSWQAEPVAYQPADLRLQSDLTEARIRQAVDEQLEQRGLRQAAANQGALRVQAQLIVDERQAQVTTQYPIGWGPYWGAPMYSETRSQIYRVTTLQLDLKDAGDGKLVWRGSAELNLSASASPQQREAAIRQTIARILSQYPPR